MNVRFPAALAVSALLAAASLAAQQSTITDTARDLNRSFDADIQQWTERFEHEGRAIYDRRYDILDELALRPGLAVADIGPAAA